MGNRKKTVVETPADPVDNVSTLKPISAALTSTTSASANDPFDLANLRISQDFISSAGVKKLRTEVSVRKPGPQEFVRVHPSPEYRMAVAVIELKEDREFYLVVPAIAKDLPGEFVMVNLFTAINRQGVVFLWPVRLPAPDGKPNKWHSSAMQAAQHAMARWIRVKANMSAGYYEIFEAASTVPDPEWKDVLETFQDLLRLAFRNLLVDRLDHAVVNRLRG
jgi:hypothetical protein